MTAGRAETGKGDPALRRWELAGITALAVIVAAVPLSLWRSPPGGTPEAGPAFVGSVACKDCHRAAWDAWWGSDHDLAMAEATEETVRGDFGGVEITHRGVTSRFYRSDGKFLVWTEGPGGEMGDFEIAYTFGHEPLQQYLVPFPGGRLQALSLAWDTERGQWFHLYADQDIPADDWLHWTRNGQNWNGMCAECHSTDLKKGYDLETRSYATTWSDIDVGCEAFDRGLGDYRQTMAYSLDFAAQAMNMGNLHAKLGQPREAERYYRMALGIDDLFYPAKMNLAVLASSQGRNPEAETLLREVLAAYPENAGAAYSLGLLLVEMERPGEGVFPDQSFRHPVPVGKYESDKLVNLGLNRLWGRIAFPMKYHFGVFAPGYMSTFELTPSVWLFGENDDFVGQTLKNDPLWQIEAHLTHDFTSRFFGSLDALYRSGFQSEIDGIEAGDDVDVGNLGFTLSFQVTDNVILRTSYLSNVLGDDNLDNSIVKMMFAYGWNRANQNAKKLMGGD